MQASTRALRALTAHLFRPYLITATIVSGLVLLLLFGLLAWAMTKSGWWGIVLVLLLPLTTVVCALIGGLWYGIRRLQPRQLSRAESKQVTAFTKKMLAIKDTVQTPWPLLALRIGYDVLRGKQTTTLQSVIQNSKNLREDFTALTRTFEK